jgi:hypothetical protein
VRIEPKQAQRVRPLWLTSARRKTPEVYPPATLLADLSPRNERAAAIGHQEQLPPKLRHLCGASGSDLEAFLQAAVFFSGSTSMRMEITGMFRSTIFATLICFLAGTAVTLPASAATVRSSHYSAKTAAITKVKKHRKVARHSHRRFVHGYVASRAPVSEGRSCGTYMYWKNGRCNDARNQTKPWKAF